MNSGRDPEKRTRDIRNLALDHFNDAQDLSEAGDVESARYEVAMAEEYREMYLHRSKSRTDINDV
jgi:hypothetical protein